MLFETLAPVTGAIDAAVAAMADPIDAILLEAVDNIGNGTPMAVLTALATTAPVLAPAKNLRVACRCAGWYILTL